jgi:hypothetical protein
MIDDRFRPSLALHNAKMHDSLIGLSESFDWFASSILCGSDRRRGLRKFLLISSPCVHEAPPHKWLQNQNRVPWLSNGVSTPLNKEIADWLCCFRLLLTGLQ